MVSFSERPIISRPVQGGVLGRARRIEGCVCVRTVGLAVWTWHQNSLASLAGQEKHQRKAGIDGCQTPVFKSGSESGKASLLSEFEQLCWQARPLNLRLARYYLSAHTALHKRYLIFGILEIWFFRSCESELNAEVRESEMTSCRTAGSCAGWTRLSCRRGNLVRGRGGGRFRWPVWSQRWEWVKHSDGLDKTIQTDHPEVGKQLCCLLWWSRGGTEQVPQHRRCQNGLWDPGHFRKGAMCSADILWWVDWRDHNSFPGLGKRSCHQLRSPSFDGTRCRLDPSSLQTCPAHWRTRVCVLHRQVEAGRCQLRGCQESGMCFDRNGSLEIQRLVLLGETCHSHCSKRSLEHSPQMLQSSGGPSESRGGWDPSVRLLPPVRRPRTPCSLENRTFNTPPRPPRRKGSQGKRRCRFYRVGRSHKSLGRSGSVVGAQR